MKPSPPIMDQMSVQMLLSRYFFALDAQDAETLASCFTDDAEFEINHEAKLLLKGRDKIREYFASALGAMVTTHSIGNTHVLLTGEAARATCHAVAHLIAQTPGGPRLITRGLRYDDDLLLTSQSWLIQRRTHRPVWQTEVATVPIQINSV